MSALPNEVEGVVTQHAESPLEAFTRTIVPTKTSPLYMCGLGIVAFAMVLLPLIYIALIALTGWAVFLHLTHDTWLMTGSSGRGGFLRLVLYLGPAVAGGILILFMVKPFFAAKTKRPEAIRLDPAKEVLLFAFVRKICELVGAPPPCRIDVDCDVNASASLRRGLWSRDLVLTLGLPLVSGLDMRQFAGVLAHEFGHFAQGAGMRLTYIIRNINFWFARVVFERDAWDAWLDKAAREADWRIAVVLHTARGAVGLTRCILRVLMQAGHAISCFMLRQMEFDADSYEAKVAGSDTFESTASRLRLLGAATETAYQDVRQSWAGGRLPENLPLLIHHKANSLPAEVIQKISSTSSTSEKTGWFHTHPCDAERILAARRLNEPGIFHLAQPATHLFSDFTQLSKTVTRHQYEKHLELKVTEHNLMSAEEMLRESAESSEADAMVRQFYGGVDLSLKPLLTTAELPALEDKADTLRRWEEARGATETLRPEAEPCSTQCVEQQGRLPDLVAAYRLASTGFKLEPKEFGLPENATSPGELEIAARTAIDAASAAVADGLTRLEPFMTALRQRVTLALQLASAETSPIRADGTIETAQLCQLLAAVAAELPRLREMGSRLHAFVLLVQNRGNHANPQRVEQTISELAAALRADVDGIDARLNHFTYPFPHVRGRVTVTDYARSDKSPENDWERLYVESNSRVDRLFALHYRLVGRILTCASHAEASLARPKPD